MNTPLPANPFVGLRPFERTDSLYYFGRDEQVRALLGRLHQSRFLAVVGSSGCGKSSLIRAGLIPALEAGFLVQERDRWRIAACKPGEGPMLHLAEALVEAAGLPGGREAASDLANRLREQGPEAAIEALAPGPDGPPEVSPVAPQTNILLLVDQFEELFRFGLDGASPAARAESESFVALLLRLAEQERLPVYCVITMRSDFIGDCDAYTGLPEAINRGQFLVPRLTRAQRREAIVGPVRLTGQRISARLVDRLLNERLDTRDDLPILQHVLLRCWDQWAASAEGVAVRGPIDDPDYDAIGTIHDALNRHAAEALAELDPSDRTLARRLFQSLTEVDARHRRIRRPACLSELAAVTRADADAERLRRVMEPFRTSGRNFLVLSDDPDPLVDISHESLIRQWQTLRDWVDQEALDAKIYRRLADTAAIHSAEQPRFYRDADLKEAVDWKWRQRPTVAWADRYSPGFAQAMDFLRDSRLVSNGVRRERKQTETARARLAEQRATLAEKEKTRARRLNVWLAAFVFAMFVASMVVLHFWQEAKVAVKTADDATGQAIIASTQAKVAAEHAYQATKQAEAQRDLARKSALAATTNLARAHEEKAVGLANRPREKRGTQEYREMFLQALQVQTQALAGKPGLRPRALASLRVLTQSNDFIKQSQPPQTPLGSPVLALALDPDAQWLAGATRKGSVRLWDASTGAPLPQRFLGHRELVVALDFHPQDDLLAGASADYTVRLWRRSTGDLVRTLDHPNAVARVIFSPDGQWLASLAKDQRVRLWRPKTGELIRTVGEQVSVIAFGSLEGKPVLAMASDRKLGIVDPDTGESRWNLPEVRPVTSLAFGSIDGSLLLAKTDGREVRLLNAATQAVVYTMERSRPIHSLAFGSRNGNPRLAIAEGNTVLLWNPVTGDTVDTMKANTEEVRAFALSRNGVLFAGTSGETISRWDPVEDDSAPLPNRVPDPVIPSHDQPARGSHTSWRTLGPILKGHTQRVNAVAFSPDGHLLASASDDRKVLLWEPSKGGKPAALPGHRGRVTAVAFSPSREKPLLASASEDGTVRVWDPILRQQVHILNAAPAPVTAAPPPVTAVAFRPPDGSLLAGASNNQVYLWNPATGALMGTLEGHRDPITAVAFSPDGQLLASAAKDRTLKLWNPDTRESLYPLLQDSAVTGIAFSRQGGQFVSTSAEHHIVRLWDSTSWSKSGRGQDPRWLYPRWVESATFSPDGRLLAGTSGDDSARLWNPRTGETMLNLQVQGKRIAAVAFSPDGRTIAGACWDSTVRLWDLQPWLLLTDDAAPSPRAALISAALQRLWGLRVTNLDIVPESWNWLFPRNGYYVDQEVTIDVRPAAATADPDSQPILRTFDIRPLLDPPPPGKDKLDQFLDWLGEQEPRLKP